MLKKIVLNCAALTSHPLNTVKNDFDVIKSYFLDSFFDNTSLEARHTWRGVRSIILWRCFYACMAIANLNNNKYDYNDIRRCSPVKQSTALLESLVFLFTRARSLRFWQIGAHEGQDDRLDTPKSADPAGDKENFRFSRCFLIANRSRWDKKRTEELCGEIPRSGSHGIFLEWRSRV